MRESRLFEKKEAFRFAFWGVVTTLANYFSFFLLQKMMAYQIANLISIIFTKVFVYYTNKMSGDFAPDILFNFARFKNERLSKLHYQRQPTLIFTALLLINQGK